MRGLNIILPILASIPNVFCLSKSRSVNDVPIVDLGYAQYQGVFDVNTNTTSYFGVRYAAPPVGKCLFGSSLSITLTCPIGELRWQAPQAPANVTGVQQADTEPSPCFSSGEIAPPDTVSTSHEKRQTPAESEDCLFLNVYFPGDSIPGTLLPTVVWIHGGAYNFGSASMFTGSDLIRESEDGVVAVIIQYRLGFFGFLAGNEVKENGVLNAGLLDQNFALRWVNQHISKFGGDPTKVTIWGESAGAGSVLQHVIAEDGQTSPQLFRGAITSSTYLPSQYLFNDTIPQSLYDQVVEQTNCTSASDTLTCLRGVDASVLQAANTKINTAGLFGTFASVPVVDGTFIRQRATEALRQGKVNGEVLLAVTNADEGSLLVNQSDPLNATFYAPQLFPKLSSNETSAIEAAYANLGSLITQDSLIMGESIFVCPTHFLLNAFQNRSFKGEFALPPAVHGLDIDYYFPTGKALSFNNTAFLNAFSQSFLSFVISLDPNVKVDPANITPQWSLYSDGNTEMKFNKTADNEPNVTAITTDDNLLERCR
uniref:Carboxylic ester hydrolase n=1 Tax=Moniliophthora roreri TaxID=221103 RepID=A0A0W0EV04_MONRR